MTTEYPGLPAVAVHYWRNYVKVAVGLGIAYTFLGALAGVVTLLLIPEAMWLFVLGLVTFVIHAAAIFLRDVREGAYDPSQTTYQSRKEVLANIVVMGSILTGILLFGTAGGYALSSVWGAPYAVAVVFAAYYPVVDLLLMSRGYYTVGRVVNVVAVRLVEMVISIQFTNANSIPVLGNRRRKRPQP